LVTTGAPNCPPKGPCTYTPLDSLRHLPIPAGAHPVTGFVSEMSKMNQLFRRLAQIGPVLRLPVGLVSMVLGKRLLVPCLFVSF